MSAPDLIPKHAIVYLFTGEYNQIFTTIYSFSYINVIVYLQFIKLCVLCFHKALMQLSAFQNKESTPDKFQRFLGGPSCDHCNSPNTSKFRNKCNFVLRTCYRLSLRNNLHKYFSQVCILFANRKLKMDLKNYKNHIIIDLYDKYHISLENIKS